MTRPTSASSKATGRAIARLIRCACAATLLLSTPQPGAVAVAQQPDAMREYLIKAAFLYELMRHTQWPGARSAELSLCIFGEDAFGRAWSSIHGRPVLQRTLAVHRLQSLDGVAACDAVYVGNADAGDLDRLIHGLGDQSVLTISDDPEFFNRGGTVLLKNIDNRLHFDVNMEAVSRAHLTIATDVLELSDDAQSGEVVAPAP